MGVVNFAVSQCTDGDVLASDVISDNGAILVAKDTSLNGYIKERLIEIGISNIYIYNNAASSSEAEGSTYLKLSKNYKESVLLVKQIINNISCGGKLEYSKAIKVSELIYDSIDGCSYIIKCMNEIHGADEYTYNHCVNTAFYSMMIGKWLGMHVSEI